MSYLNIHTYNGDSIIPFTPDKEYDKVKVMVWKDFNNFIPLCAADDVNIN